MSASKFGRSIRDGWGRDIAAAARGLMRSPVYALAAVLSVLLGVGATTAVFSVFDAIVLAPLPFEDEGKLVVVFDDVNSPGLEAIVISRPELEDYRRMSSSFTSFAAYGEAEATVTGLGEPVRLATSTCTPNYFETLGVQPAIGRGFVSSGAGADGPDVVVISHNFWVSALGGNRAALGRTLAVDGKPYTIIGIMGDDRMLPSQAQLWMPIQFTPAQSTGRGNRFLFTVARLRDGVTLEGAKRDMASVSQNLQPVYLSEHVRPAVTVLVPIRKHLLGDSSTIISIVLAAVCLVLLLSCANISTLMLTRASVRSRELAVKAALGAGTTRLVREQLAEVLVISLVGGALGLGFALLGARVAVHLYGAQLFAYARPGLDGRVIAFGLGVSILSGIVSGGGPALRASRVSPMDALRGGGRGSASKSVRRRREALVCAQVVLAFVLLVGAGSMIRSVSALLRVSPGFDPSNVVSARVSLSSDRYKDPARIRQFYGQLLDGLRASPGFSAAAISVLPFSDTYDTTIGVDTGEAEPLVTHAEERVITSGYFEAMRSALVSGRALVDSDLPEAESVAVVNRAFSAAYFHGQDALGKRFQTGRRGGPSNARIWTRIVGVAEDAREFGLDADTRPTFYVSFSQVVRAEMSLVVRAQGTREEVTRRILQHVQALDASVPMYDMSTLQERLDTTYAGRTVLVQVLSAFALVAIGLATVGLFGVTSYSVSQRSREIGIRRAIGATEGAIVRMILLETGVVIALGIAVGVGCAVYVSRFIEGFVFGIPGVDVPTYLVVGLVIMSSALAAALGPARQAAAVDPVIALRAE